MGCVGSQSTRTKDALYALDVASFNAASSLSGQTTRRKRCDDELGSRAMDFGADSTNSLAVEHRRPSLVRTENDLRARFPAHRHEASRYYVVGYDSSLSRGRGKSIASAYRLPE